MQTLTTVKPFYAIWISDLALAAYKVRGNIMAGLGSVAPAYLASLRYDYMLLWILFKAPQNIDKIMVYKASLLSKLW